MSTRSVIAILTLMTLLAWLGGCAKSAADMAQMPNEKLRAFLLTEFPLGSSRSQVQQRAERLKLEPVREVRLVNEDGTEVKKWPADLGESSLSAKRMRMVEADVSDPRCLAYQIGSMIASEKAWVDGRSRAVMFVFSRDEARVLAGISVSPSIGFISQRMYEESFVIGDATAK